MAYVDISNTNPKKKGMQGIADYLLQELAGYNDDGTPIDVAGLYSEKGSKLYNNTLAKEVAAKRLTEDAAVKMGKDYTKAYTAAQPFLTEGANPGFKDYAGLAGRAAAAHPFKTAALGGLTAGNLGGLFDNDKFGGQIAGAGLGGLGAYYLASNPYAAAMMTLGGGELGALFDKLRAKKEQQAQQMPQNPYRSR